MNHHPANTPLPGSSVRLRGLLAAAIACLAVLVAAPNAAAQGDPTVSPSTTLSPDGRTATDGVRTLTVSQVHGLSPAGQTVSVAGLGYDTNKGVYVALCVIPPRDVLPTPCGGGIDMEGQAGASQWISSNPPSYGVGLARPYGPGGSFDTTFHLSPMISPTVDCRQVRCAVLTRNDHSRSTDRSQDILVPVAFAAVAPNAASAPSGAGRSDVAPGAAGAPRTAPATTAPPTTAPVPTTTTTTTPPAPEATVSPDGRSVTDGRRTLRADRVEGLDPEGDVVTVSGERFDATRGVYVALCRTDGEGPAPGPCATGEGRAAWIVSDPPAWGADLATPYDAGGRFEVELELAARLDATTDCADEGVRCAVVVRADDTATADRSLDLALPVAFGAGEPAEEVASARTERGAAAPASSSDRGTGSGGWALPAAGLAATLAAGAAGLAWWRLRRRQAPVPSGATAAEQPGWSR